MQQVGDSRSQLPWTSIALGVVAGLSVSYHLYTLLKTTTPRIDEQQGEQDELRSELEKMIKLRQDERNGRVAAEKLLRQQINSSRSASGYNYQAIGFVESPFVDRRGTPRQPMLVPAAKAFIRFNKHSIQRAHFEELTQFSHVWVVFVFHENTNVVAETQQKGKKGKPRREEEEEGEQKRDDSFKPVMAKIRPPRLHGAKVGCLSTRSPHRPNNIGLSVCEVVSIGNDYLELRCVDMVHGTPVLDVKPYIPYDVVPSDYTLPMAYSANGTMLPLRKLEVPSWVVDTDIPLLPVHFPESVVTTLDMATKRKKLKFCKDANEAMELVTQVLRQDIRGVQQGRGQVAASGSEEGGSTEGGEALSEKTSSNAYHCRLDATNITFITTSEGIEIQSIEIV